VVVEQDPTYGPLPNFQNVVNCKRDQVPICRSEVPYSICPPSHQSVSGASRQGLDTYLHSALRMVNRSQTCLSKNHAELLESDSEVKREVHALFGIKVIVGGCPAKGLLLPSFADGLVYHAGLYGIRLTEALFETVGAIFNP
jgi:hypothetical protein